MTRGQALGFGAVALALLIMVTVAAGQQLSEQPTPTPEHPIHPMHDLKNAAVALPIAAGLGAILALRPRRRASTPRIPAVIETQIILAIVGAVIMLIVGASLARAFGIVGAASLIRYRSKIEDPKDAGVMLSALAIGLACGVGIYALAAFATGFIMLVLWMIESFGPEGQKVFELKIKTKDAQARRNNVEALLRRQQIAYDLRSSSAEELSYEVKVPLERRTERISNAILRLDHSGDTSVDWDEKTKKGK
jgi:hypothetical protein